MNKFNTILAAATIALSSTVCGNSPKNQTKKSDFPECGPDITLWKDLTSDESQGISL